MRSNATRFPLVAGPILEVMQVAESARSGLIIRRSQVQVLPAPQPFPPVSVAEAFPSCCWTIFTPAPDAIMSEAAVCRRS